MYAMSDDCCPAVFGPDLATADAAAAATAFKALADPARVRILNLVAEVGEACNCHLTEPLGLSQPTVSHHLALLHEAGLLARERRGKYVYFRIDEAGVESVRSALRT